MVKILIIHFILNINVNVVYVSVHPTLFFSVCGECNVLNTCAYGTHSSWTSQTDNVQDKSTMAFIGSGQNK